MKGLASVGRQGAHQNVRWHDALPAQTLRVRLVKTLGPAIDVATQRLRRGSEKIKRSAVPRRWVCLTTFDLSHHSNPPSGLPQVTERCSNATKSDNRYRAQSTGQRLNHRRP